MSKKKQPSLTSDEKLALANLRRGLLDMSFVESILLYGSAARGEADEESDIDLLVLTSKKLTRPERHQITDLVYQINLAEDTNFSTLVVDRTSWENGIFSVLPIHEQIAREGIAV